MILFCLKAVAAGRGPDIVGAVIDSDEEGCAHEMHFARRDLSVVTGQLDTLVLAVEETMRVRDSDRGRHKRAHRFFEHKKSIGGGFGGS